MKNNLLLIAIIVIILAVVGFFALSNLGQKSSNNNKVKVTASFYPLFFFASEIGGEKADVSNITPAGAEPHDYDPTARDIANIEKGDILILNGGVEAWGDKIKKNLANSDVIVVEAGEGLITRNIVEEGKNQTDPHIWLDPVLAKREASKITDGFVKKDPANASFYKTSEDALDQKLDSLDKKYREGLKSCKNKSIVTSHAAFGYLGQRYGLRQVSVSGISPDEEPSVKQLAEVADFARRNNVKYIFFEALVSPKLSETIANEIGAQTLVLDPIEGISDNDIKQGKNYFTQMESNLKNLQLALQCNP